MIESYPYFLLRNGEAFRFQFHMGVTHEIVTLPAGVSDNLKWDSYLDGMESIINSGKKILVHLNLQLEQSIRIFTESDFNSFVLGIEEFNKKIFSKYKDSIDGVILYQGTLHLDRITVLEEDDINDHIENNLIESFDHGFKTRMAAANILGSIVHRLVAFLDDSVCPFIIFNDSQDISPLERAVLLSKERFDHIYVIASMPEFQYINLDVDQGLSSLGYMSHSESRENEDIRTGFLLPSDCHLNSESYQKIETKLNELISSKTAFRMICDKIFNECWNDIDQVIYSKNHTLPMTLRMIKGFEASGGSAEEF
jgi:hypothetical protein